MKDPRDQLDLLTGPRSTAETPQKPWLGLYFKCSKAYVRAYRNNEGTAYRGQCPRCGKTMQFIIGTGGTSRRNFQVSC